MAHTPQDAQQTLLTSCRQPERKCCPRAVRIAADAKSGAFRRANPAVQIRAALAVWRGSAAKADTPRPIQSNAGEIELEFF
jgi:hypothetical protein